MVMHLADSLYLFPALLYGTVIEYQSPDLTVVLSYSARKVQVPLCKQIQDHTPVDVFIAQQIIVRILAAIFVYPFLKLPGEIVVDIPVAVEQHNQQGSHNQGNPYTALLDRFKLPEYALYVKEP